jgi:DNA-binding MarR family transcriptional regulator
LTTKRSVKPFGRAAPGGARLGTALRALASADVLYNAAVAERLGISPTDLRCLSHLDAQGSATAGELARWSGLTTGAITGAINRLQDAGLVRREADPADARRVRVVPIDDRRQEVEALMRPLGERLGAMAAQLSAGEQRALAAFVDEACAALTVEARRIRYRTDDTAGPIA